MGRPPTPIGAWGDIYVTPVKENSRKKTFMARATLRYADGISRPVKRHGRTATQAKARLLDALAEESGQTRDGEITGAMRVCELAEVWLAEEERLAAQGTKRMTSVDQYRDHYRRHVDKGLGQRRVRECTVSAIHNFLVKIAAKSPSTAVMCRKVLSNMLGLAVRHGALPTNPVRDAGRIKRKAKGKPRALVAAQIKDWLSKVDNNELAIAQDLPDLSRMLLATGARIGEILGLSWTEYSSKKRSVTWAYHMVYLKGQGIVRVPSTKSDDDDAEPVTQRLPEWAVEMLDERRKRFGPSGLLGPIFPHPVTSKYRDHREVGKVFRAVRGEMGYPWMTSHQLGRKTVATILDQGGATAREIADQLRHARPSMTQDVYMARDLVNERTAQILDITMSTEINDVG